MSRTILLVEDSVPVRHLTRELLEASGYRVLEAADGEAALIVAARHPGQIDLLLTDLVLPGTSGLALARRMLELRPGIHVLYSSGYASDAVLQEGTLEGEVHGHAGTAMNPRAAALPAALPDYAEAIGGQTIDAEGLAVAVANRAERLVEGNKLIETLID